MASYISAGAVPSITELRSTLGYGDRRESRCQTFYDDMRAFRKKFVTLSGIKGWNLHQWKDTGHHDGLREMVESFLEGQNNGRLFWPDDTASDNHAVLKYTKDTSTIKELLIQLFFRLNLQSYRNKKYREVAGPDKVKSDCPFNPNDGFQADIDGLNFQPKQPTIPRYSVSTGPFDVPRIRKRSGGIVFAINQTLYSRDGPDCGPPAKRSKSQLTTPNRSDVARSKLLAGPRPSVSIVHPPQTLLSERNVDDGSTRGDGEAGQHTEYPGSTSALETSEVITASTDPKTRKPATISPGLTTQEVLEGEVGQTAFQRGGPHCAASTDKITRTLLTPAPSPNPKPSLIVGYCVILSRTPCFECANWTPKGWFTNKTLSEIKEEIPLDIEGDASAKGLVFTLVAPGVRIRYDIANGKDEQFVLMKRHFDRVIRGQIPVGSGAGPLYVEIEVEALRDEGQVKNEVVGWEGDLEW